MPLAFPVSISQALSVCSPHVCSPAYVCFSTVSFHGKERCLDFLLSLHSSPCLASEPLFHRCLCCCTLLLLWLLWRAGVFVADMYPGVQTIDEGTYALLGAASFLGGCMRMTVATCVMLLELTNNLALLPMIMLVTLVAKVRGEWWWWWWW